MVPPLGSQAERRLSLACRPFSSMRDGLKEVELLGEGSFSKVFGHLPKPNGAGPVQSCTSA